MKLIYLLPLLFLCACWSDHFDMSDRLLDDELAELKTKEGFLSQYEYLREKESFTLEDFNKPEFTRLSADQRVELYISLNDELSDQDKKVLRSKKFYDDVSMEWILVLFGPPDHKDANVSGFQTWFYKGKSFSFHQGVLVRQR